MNDLIVASMILGVLSLTAFASGLWLGRHGSSRLRIAIEGIAVTLLGGYLLTIWNRPLLVDLIPSSGLIILANWLPLWGCFFAGVYAASTAISRYRRVVITCVTVMLSAYSGVAPLFGTPPDCKTTLPYSDLQHQTTPYTCSPAAAATVLRLHGIEATERELAELCLTRQGTHWLGLYRGLKVKTTGTNWDVCVEPFSMDALSQHTDLPCILSVNIDTSGFDPEIDHGFLDNMGHSVVCLQRNRPHYMTVFDPSPDYGVEIWNHGILDCVSSGVILRLVPMCDDTRERVMVSRRTAQVANSTLTAGL